METNKRKALGKGLEQLFSNESLYVEPTVYVEPAKKIEEIVENTPKEDIVEVNVSELRSNPYQPRQTFDQEKLVELSNTLRCGWPIHESRVFLSLVRASSGLSLLAALLPVSSFDGSFHT